MNPDERREYNKKYKAEHKEYYREWAKSNYDPDKRKQQYLSNIDKVLDLAHKYYERFAEKRREYTRQYKLDHRENKRIRDRNRRARKKMSGETITESQWLELKVFYGSRCLGCGKVEPDVILEPDHVVPLALGGSNTIDNIQPLCTSCNRKKYTKTIDYRRPPNGKPVSEE